MHPDFAAGSPSPTGGCGSCGEPIAVVLAETFEQGEDAAELVWADIDPLATYVDAEAALAADAVEIFPGHGSNEAMVIADKPRTDLSLADVVVRGRYVNQRMAVVPMEPDCSRPRSTPTDGSRSGRRHRCHTVCTANSPPRSGWTPHRSG